MVVPTSSLRERSKAKRRAAIQRAAMRLFAERGYEGATIAEIAEAAEVAPRTVSMYFPSKLDIAMSMGNDVANRLTETFRAHPELAFTEVVDLWLQGEAEAKDPEMAMLTIAMLDANPGLRAMFGNPRTDVSQLSETALLAQLGRGPDDPMTAVVRAAVSAALTEYVTTFLKTDGPHVPHAAFMDYLRTLITTAHPT